MSATKSILYVWKGEYPWDVRAEKVCKAFMSAGYEVYMLARWQFGAMGQEIIDGIKVIRVGVNKKRIMSEPISANPVWKNAIADAIKTFKPSVVMPREIMLAKVCAQEAKKYQIPVIMDMAEHYPAAMKEWKKYRDDMLRRIIVHRLDIPEKVEKNSVPLMDGIVTVCDEQGPRLLNEYKYPVENTCVVHNTASRTLFKESEVIRYKRDITFGHHGNMTDEKKLNNLVYAFDKVAETNPNIKLVLAGEGESFPELKSIVSSLKNKDKIELIGKYPYWQLDQILSKIDIGVIPYQVNDFNNYTLHNKVFDFFAKAKPVLVSPSIPLKRLISETNAGIYAKSDSIDHLALAIDYILKMDIEILSENSKKAFEKYNWENDANRMINFVEKIIRNKNA